jgi:hypothetical protein
MWVFTAVNKTIQNGYAFPTDGNFTGGFQFHESKWQVLIITMPYRCLRGMLTILQTAYMVKLSFVLLSILLIAWAAKEITGTYKASIWSLALFAVYPTAELMQQIPMWVGDFFTSILLLAAVLLLYLAKKSYRQKWKSLIYAMLSIVFLITAYSIWNGGIYAVAAYSLVLVYLLVSSWLRDIKKALILSLVATGIAYLVCAVSPYSVFLFRGLPIYPNILPLLSQQLFSNWNNFTFFTIPGSIGITIFGAMISSILVILALSDFLHGKGDELLGILLLLIAIGLPMALTDLRFNSLIIMEIAIVSGISISRIESRMSMLMFFLLIVVCGIIIITEAGAQAPIFSSTPAFHSAMAWANGNTPPDSLFLTDVNDGISVEYWSNRSVYSTYWYGSANDWHGFSDWLFSPECNSGYLLSTKADYLIINRFWLPINATTGWEYIEMQYNLTIKPSNSTLLELENATMASCGNATLELAYRNGLTSIYRIEYQDSV